jgi:hypothetical protein
MKFLRHSFALVENHTLFCQKSQLLQVIFSTSSIGNAVADIPEADHSTKDISSYRYTNASTKSFPAKPMPAQRFQQ